MWIKLNAFALAVRVARLLMLYSPPSSLQNPECPHFLFPFSFSFLSGSEAHFLFTAAFPFSGRVDPSAAFRRRCRVRDYQSLYASLPLRVASFTRFAPMP
jgi:hypothetical protein